ncbi:helix-turn-helix domain-containing protein [Enterobacter asburiae]|uniref:helix-turn-helix domain-containing protein n=1 Tax=Enterobacter asburiae TaxID=61645 RepID=UPI00192A714F|nr:helix-turn-helix domain-containing protein [Enterobacter asburiae]
MRIDKSFSVLCSYGILSNPKVSPTDLRIYLYIKFRWQFFQSRGAEFCESTTTISKEIGVSEKTVRRAMDNLEKLGYLEIVNRPGKTSLYIPKDEAVK